MGAILMAGWGAISPSSTPSTADTVNPGTTVTIPADTSDTGAAPTPAAVTSNALTVNAQAAGMSVAVAAATVTAPTWLAVYETSNGQITGKALGATMFFPRK